MLGYQAARELGVERMSTAGRARMHQGSVTGWASSLLGGNVGSVLQDIVDRDQLCAGPL